jgi:hypothetical protein
VIQMSDSLQSYLHDHLAGSHFATKLLNALQEQYKEEPLGAFAGAMLAEVAQDQKTLEQIIQQVGTGLTGDFCTSREERLEDRKEPENAKEDVYARADRFQAAAD